MPIKHKIINRDGSRCVSGLQKPDRKELQKIWDLIDIEFVNRSKPEYLEQGDTFLKFSFNKKFYKIEIKEVNK